MNHFDCQHLRFVLADDSIHMRRIVRSMLRSSGAREILEADDGAACLEMVEAYNPDVLITDIKMPIFDGLELVQMIRHSDKITLARLPIIILSGHSERDIVVKAHEAGANSFLRKPVSTTVLIERIQFILQKECRLPQEDIADLEMASF